MRNKLSTEANSTEATSEVTASDHIEAPGLCSYEELFDFGPAIPVSEYLKKLREDLKRLKHKRGVMPGREIAEPRAAAIM